MLDQKENQGYDLVVFISFDPIADRGNGRGNNCNSNIVNKGSNNKGSTEAMHGDQLLLNSYLKKLAFWVVLILTQSTRF